MLMGKEAPHHSSFCKSCNNHTFLPRTVGSSLKFRYPLWIRSRSADGQKNSLYPWTIVSASVPLPYLALKVIVSVETAS